MSDFLHVDQVLFASLDVKPKNKNAKTLDPNNGGLG